MMVARLAAILGLIATSATAQPVPCGPREAVTKNLTGKYQEQQVWLGIRGDNVAWEVWASPSGSWTILTTTPDGISCLRFSGEGWASGPLPVEGDPT